MSDAEKNKAILANIYRRWHETRGHALDELFAICADDIRFGSLGEGADPLPFTALASGKPEMRRYFEGLHAGWTMNHYTVHDMIAERDRVAAVVTTSWTNKMTRKSFDTPKLDLWRFRDGLAVQYYEYFDTARVFAAAT